jgi:two-component system phosphate regulon sensor histidine kinase PhoR
LERDARLKAELLGELREATRLGERASVQPSSQIDLAELVRSTTESLAVVAHVQDIAIDVRCAATSVIIFADAEDLTHVVARLLASAIAWSARGGTVDCELSLSAHSIRMVVRAVNNYAGPARIPRVLESSSHPSDLNAAAWEALGLTTVPASIHRQGGIVRVEAHDSQLVLTLSLPGDPARSIRAAGEPTHH